MPSSASAPTYIHTLSLHDALPIYLTCRTLPPDGRRQHDPRSARTRVAEHDEPGDFRRRNGAQFDHRRLRTRQRSFVPGDRQPGLRRSEEHTSELQSHHDLVCRLLLPRPPTSTLFPYTTLFRSISHVGHYRLTGVASMILGALGLALLSTMSPATSDAEMVRNLIIAGFGLGSALSSLAIANQASVDRKSTRLNSSHITTSYAVFCFRAHLHPHSFPTRRSSDLSHMSDTTA